LDFVAGDRRFEHVAPRTPAVFGDGQDRRDDDGARMGRRLDVGVVELIAVAERAVQERGIADGHLVAVIDDGGALRRAHREDARAVACAPGPGCEGDLATELVEHEQLGVADDVARDLVERQAGNERREPLRVVCQREDPLAQQRTGAAPCSTVETSIAPGEVTGLFLNYGTLADFRNPP